MYKPFDIKDKTKITYKKYIVYIQKKWFFEILAVYFKLGDLITC